MNLKNLMMWGLIVLLVVGLFQLFQNSERTMVSEKIPFSSFLENLEEGRVVQVEIKEIILKVFYLMARPLIHILLMIQI